MRRAIIFRYDSARRRVRAAGAHGLDLEQFADAHVTLESAPIAARALREDRVIEVTGDVTGQLPQEYAALVSEPVRLVCAPMAAAGRAVGVILADRLLSRRRSTTPSATCCGRSAKPRRSRRWPGSSPPRRRTRQPAPAADRPGARDPRGRDPAPVRGLDGARRRGRPARRRARALRGPRRRRRSPTYAGAAASARPRAARHGDDVLRRGRAAQPRASRPRPDARGGRRRGRAARRSSRSRNRC